MKYHKYVNITYSGCTKDGGAIYVGFGTLNLNNVTANENEAAMFGGVVDTVGATINVDGGSYSNNQAQNGGVFYISSNDIETKLNIQNAEFNNNKSTSTTSENKYGGGVINMTDGELSIKSSTFDGNQTENYGGVVLANKTNVNIEGDSVFTNSIGKTGSALGFIASPSVTIKDTEITNTNGSGNGVLYITGGTATLTNLTANGNTSSYGGVIFVTSNYSRLYLTGDVNLSNNTAKSGSFAYLYVSDTYDCPPKIYTTHSNTASWVSEVAGNSTNIAFDLDVLP